MYRQLTKKKYKSILAELSQGLDERSKKVIEFFRSAERDIRDAIGYSCSMSVEPDTLKKGVLMLRVKLIKCAVKPLPLGMGI